MTYRSSPNAAHLYIGSLEDDPIQYGIYNLDVNFPTFQQRRNFLQQRRANAFLVAISPFQNLFWAPPQSVCQNIFTVLRISCSSHASKSILPIIIESFSATSLGESGYMAKIASREGVISSKAKNQFSTDICFYGHFGNIFVGIFSSISLSAKPIKHRS